MIGNDVLMDYAQMNVKDFRYPLNIDLFARRYLGIDIRYRKLSDSGKLWGLTAYGGIEVELPASGDGNTILAPEDTIYLEAMLMQPDKNKYRRFTIAHECGHHILARIVEQRTGISFRRAFEPGRRYTSGELKTAEDWGEWQANSLGALLLMPKSKITPHMAFGRKTHILAQCGDRFNSMDYEKIKALANMFDVSLGAMKIRLKDIGFVVNRLESEYADPLNVLVG